MTLAWSYKEWMNVFSPLDKVAPYFSIGHRPVFPLTLLPLLFTLAIGESTTVWGSHLTLKKPPPAIERMYQKKRGASSQSKPPPSLKNSIDPSKNPEIKTTTMGVPTPSGLTPKPLPENFTKKGQPHTLVGWNFLLNGRPRAAIAAYRQALRTNPNSAKAYLGLGITLKTLGSAETAKRALVQAANLNPRLPSALVHLGYLYADGQLGQPDTKRARQLFYQAAQLGDPFANIALLDLKARTRS